MFKAFTIFLGILYFSDAARVLERNSQDHVLILLITLIFFLGISFNQRIFSRFYLEQLLLWTGLLFVIPVIISGFNCSLEVNGFLWFAQRIIVGLIIITGLSFVLTTIDYYFLVTGVAIISGIGVFWSVIDFRSFELYFLSKFNVDFGGLNPIGGGFQVNRNGAAYILVTCQAIFSLLAKDDKRFNNFFIHLFVVTAVAVTASRSGILLSTMMFLVILTARKTKGLLAIVTVVILFFISGFQAKDIAIYHRLTENKTEATESSNARLKGARIAIDDIFENFLFGKDTFDQARTNIVQSHNVYIYLMQHTGILGSVLSLALFLFITRRWKSLEKHRGFINVFFVLAIIGLFDHLLLLSKYFLLVVLFPLIQFNAKESLTRYT